MAKTTEKTFYLVHYKDPQTGANQSIKARSITDSSLGLSFICLADFVFEDHGILVNPDEEAKKLAFEDIKALHLSIYSIQSVAEVGAHKNNLSFKNDKSNLFVLNTDSQESPKNWFLSSSLLF